MSTRGVAGPPGQHHGTERSPAVPPAAGRRATPGGRRRGPGAAGPGPSLLRSGDGRAAGLPEGLASRGAGLLLLLALALAGCATGSGSSPFPAAGGGPAVIPLGADPDAGARMVAERAASAQVVYLGEMHDNPEHHAIQARIVRALLAAGDRPALAFEMIPETRQAAADAALHGDAGMAEVERQLAWRAQGWPDFAMYWPLFELAREHGLPVVGTDLDPAVTRRIGRGGLGAAGEDPDRLRSAIPDDPARDLAITRRIQAAHCNLVSETRSARMLESWYARNVVIARRIADALASAPQVVVIIGRGHQSPGGVPEQLEAIRPGTRQLVVGLVEAPDARADREPAPPTADVVWLTAARERPDFCRGLQQRLG